MDDGQILQQIRAIYVRNSVDTQFLQIDVTGKAVFVKGVFTVHIYKANPKSTNPAEIAKIKDEVQKTLKLVEQQIMAIGEIKSLTFEYDNWMKTGGGWIQRKV